MNKCLKQMFETFWNSKCSLQCKVLQSCWTHPNTLIRPRRHSRLFLWTLSTITRAKLWMRNVQGLWVYTMMKDVCVCVCVCVVQSTAEWRFFMVLPHVGRSSDALFALRLSQWKSPRVFLSQWGAFCHGRCPMPNLPRHVLPNFALGFCTCWQNLANDTWRKMARPHDICKLCSKIPVPVAFSCIFKCIKSHVCSLIQRSLFEIPMHCHSPC